MPVVSLRRALLAAAILGSLLGALSAFGDAARITVVNGLANAAGPWVVTAFAAGGLTFRRTHGAVAGSVALGVAIAWYYGRWVGAQEFPVVFAIAWLILAAIAGPTFGMLGAIWRTDASRRLLILSVGLLAGALLGEAAHRLVLLEAWGGIDPARTYTQVAIADTVAAIALVLALGRGGRWPTLGIAALVASGWTAVLFGIDALFRSLPTG